MSQKNGYEAMYCLSPQTYKDLIEQVAKAQLIARLKIAEHEIENGLCEDYDTSVEKIRQKYDL